MKDWTEYTKSKISEASSEGNKPSIMEYVIIKLTDNFLAVAVFCLCLIFGYLGLFKLENNEISRDWALHASELCLGVFLGLLARRNLK